MIVLAAAIVGGVIALVVLRVSRARIRSAERDRARREREQALNEMKDAFLCAVSHEMRTPLTSIVGFAAMLEKNEKASPEQVRDWARRVSVNAQRLHRLLSDLLDLDRFRRGIVQARRHPTDVVALVRGALADFDLGDHTLTVEVDAVTAVVDAALVERALENLLVNAVRHTPPGTSIWLRAGKDEEGGLVLTVEDAGHGVPDDQKAVIFETLRQGGPEPQPRGAGLGLALVAAFAKLHGGRAWVEDRPGGGAFFHAAFPSWAGRHGRVLVVDWDGACHLCQRVPETVEIATCAGPGDPPLMSRCPLVTGGACDQARTAEAIVVSLPTGVHATAQLEIARAYRANFPEVPVILEVPEGDLDRLRDYSGCRAMPAPVTEAELDDVLRRALPTASPP